MHQLFQRDVSCVDRRFDVWRIGKIHRQQDRPMGGGDFIELTILLPGSTHNHRQRELLGNRVSSQHHSFILRVEDERFGAN